MFAVLPTLLTLGNAVCGFGAITLALQWTSFDRGTSLLAASALIFLAMVFDGLDGAAARWARQESEFGARLDSLCDAISFGAAPAVLTLALGEPYGYDPWVMWIAAALYMVCAVLRLARFGVESHDGHDPGMFWGLPSPAAAAVVASFPIMLFGPQVVAAEAGLSWLVTRLMPVVTLLAAGLMVSRIRYWHAARRLVRGRRRGTHVIRLVFAAAIIAAVPRVTIPLLAFWYAFAPPLWAVWYRYRRGPQPTPADSPMPPTPAPQADHADGDGRA